MRVRNYCVFCGAPDPAYFMSSRIPERDGNKAAVCFYCREVIGNLFGPNSADYTRMFGGEIPDTKKAIKAANKLFGFRTNNL